jgi:hypothetical protein
VYVANLFGDSVSQYSVDPSTGNLSPKSPPTVPAGSLASDVVVAPLPRLPTSKDQCKKGGWQNFGAMFKNQGQCVAFVERGPGPH